MKCGSRLWYVHRARPWRTYALHVSSWSRLHAGAVDKAGDAMLTTVCDRLHWLQSLTRLPVRHAPVPVPQVHTEVELGSRGRGRRQVASRDRHVVRIGGTFALYRRYTGQQVRRRSSYFNCSVTLSEEVSKKVHTAPESHERYNGKTATNGVHHCLKR